MVSRGPSLGTEFIALDVYGDPFKPTDRREAAAGDR